MVKKLTSGNEVSDAGLIAIAAVAGGYASYWVEKYLAYPFPIDIILLLLSSFVIFIAVLFALKMFSKA